MVRKAARRPARASECRPSRHDDPVEDVKCCRAAVEGPYTWFDGSSRPAESSCARIECHSLPGECLRTMADAPNTGAEGSRATEESQPIPVDSPCMPIDSHLLPVDGRHMAVECTCLPVDGPLMAVESRRTAVECRRRGLNRTHVTRDVPGKPSDDRRNAADAPSLLQSAPDTLADELHSPPGTTGVTPNDTVIPGRPAHPVPGGIRESRSSRGMVRDRPNTRGSLGCVGPLVANRPPSPLTITRTATLIDRPLRGWCQPARELSAISDSR